MRKFAIISILIILSICLILAGAGIALAYSSPFRPGSLLFPLQDAAEQFRVSLVDDPVAKTELFIQLASQRLEDLGDLKDTSRQEAALREFNFALDRAIQSLGALINAEDHFPRLQTLLAELARNAEAVLTQFDAASQEDPAFFSQLIVKVNTLRRMLEEPDAIEKIILLVSPVDSVPSEIHDPNQPTPTPMGIAVIFPPGSKGAEHAFFRLVGKHAELSCVTCHVGGRYAGTLSMCVDCHRDVKPANHKYPMDDCVYCHTPIDWKTISFDHQKAGVEDCQSCHAQIKPAGHYNGVCSACHSTSAWRPASFNHEAVGATDCQSCHSGRKPAGHYAGQCSACHSTSAWRPASFNHEAVGATDCQSCHSGRKPAGHYAGQCSACHSTSGWKPASFNHEAVGATDCQSCHSGRKPAGHFGGQCSACHNTSGWRPASFNHEAMGATDCVACHSGTRPASHSDGQCSNCHNTSSWGGASFNHSFPTNHGDAGGVCARCHPSGGSDWTCYTCHDQGTMTNKHTEKNISDISNCLSCHPQGKKEDN